MPPPNRQDLWKSGRDETVEVNQRALIDKILARYSGEHTIFRELLQNADDAGAAHVQVRFYSHAGIDAIERGEGPSTLPDIKKDPIVRYVVANDGIPFRTEDWQRLKKIAEGNPDEEKIGAVCDDPFVESGDKWMGFYWKDGKDQLLARSGDLPSSSGGGEPSTSGQPWTTFTMALRSPAPLDGPLDFARFLITSLTFMRTMKRIDMMVDDIKVLEVRKDVKTKNRVGKAGLKDTSSVGMMKVNSVDATGMTITVRVMQWLSASGFTLPPLPVPTVLARPAKAFGGFFGSTFFNKISTPPTPVAPTPPPPPEDPTEVAVLAREIEIYQADIKVNVSPSFGRELERATKKPPPSRMPASLVFSRGEMDDVNKGEESNIKDVGAVFSGLCPALNSEKSAKIFIGQATGQTTGIGGHLAARFIPTVERESVDLVDRHVAQWNKELLWVGGYLSRLIYELEMASIKQLWDETTISDQATRNKLLSRGLHALQFFSFKTTTPSAVVGQEMESAFYKCANNNSTLPIISTSGILPIKEVRMPNDELLKFVPELAVLTSATISDAPRSVARLRELNLLRDVAFDDVIQQLGKRPLTEKEMISCLIWWQSIAEHDAYGPHVRARLLDAAILVTDAQKIVPLSIIQTYVKPQSSSIPTDMPLPLHTLPYTITKDLKGSTIYTIFGWTELSLLQYITFLIQPPMSDHPGADPSTDIRTSPLFAERVLNMLGRAWQSISANQQSAIALELKDVPCVPTKAGFKKPREAYFEKNLLFDDLPIIALPKTPTIKGGMEKMLLAIGVRRTVDLQLVFSRLVGGGEWTCLDLMRYLVSVRDTLSNEEMARLRQTAAFPLYQEPLEDGSKPPMKRRKPHELYEPVGAMKQLGLPLLDWGEAKWRSGSDEAKMLFGLGLRKYPPIDVLLGIAAGRPPTNQLALQYLLAHSGTHYVNFDPLAFAGVAFIPAKTHSGATILAKPGEVFTNPACSILGFAVADASVSSPENAAKLRIPTDPPMENLVDAIIMHPTQDVTKARTIFEYLATRVGQAAITSLNKLATTAFIPVVERGVIRMARPSEVYLVSKRDNNSNVFRSAFTFVDFGDRANLFLRQCGVLPEPSVTDVAKLLLRQPQKMLDQAGSPEKYLEELRMIAAHWSTFDNSMRLAMSQTPFLLATQLVPVKKSNKVGDEEYDREWTLASASDIAIVDNITYVQYFGTHILAAPEEQLLEEFYAHLGSKPLSSFVRTQEIPVGPLPPGSEQSKALRRHVLDRITIFLSETRRRHSEYSSDWLSKEGNFEVAEVRELKVRYTYQTGKFERQHHEMLYAIATKQPRTKGIILTVSVSAHADDWDIAAALTQLLLKHPKADDALLLYSILTTPLMALKKRGFNVDRILNQHREEKLRKAAEVARDREKLALESAKAELEDHDAISATSQRDETASSSTSSTRERKLSSTGSNSFLNKLRRSMSNKSSRESLENGIPGAFPTIGGGRTHSHDQYGDHDHNRPLGGGGLATIGNNGSHNGSKVGTTTKRPTGLKDIRNTVQKAVSASKPETMTNISDSKNAVKDVSESQENYCDESAEAHIRLALDRGPNMNNIWVPLDIPRDEEAAFLEQRMDINNEFNNLLTTIGPIFNLSPNVINIFWDHQGPMIAFNRNASIFCNARYFAAWHYAQCKSGIKTDAYISWYFSIAHELAHNLETAHNASHEFYFSAIAEEYLVPFTRLLTGTVPST